MNAKSKNLRAIRLRNYWLAIAVSVVVGGPATTSAQRFENIKSAHERGISENAFRHGLGLRIIGQDWICFRSLNNKEEWLRSENDKAAVKIVRRDPKGRALQEEDRYLSGRSVAMEEAEGVVAEQIVISYDYSTKQMEVNYVGLDRSIEDAIGEAKTNNLRLALIERVKRKWRIEE